MIPEWEVEKGTFDHVCCAQDFIYPPVPISPVNISDDDFVEHDRDTYQSHNLTCMMRTV
jgi:hypothetical protein